MVGGQRELRDVHIAQAQPTATLATFLGLMGLVLVTLVVAASAATGMYTSTRRALLAQLQQRAEQAESGRATAEEQARRAERTRIARELHDIVAHKISLVAMHAGALEVNPNLDRAQVQQSAGLIRQTATTALSELREVLGEFVGFLDHDDVLAGRRTPDEESPAAAHRRPR